MIPGEIFSRNKEIICNEGRDTIELTVSNLGDRPIQVGSHFHFFEVNKMLKFTREKAYGKRLNIPSGTAVRFEPGEEKKVSLVGISGEMKVYGLNGLTSGKLNDNKEESLEIAKKSNFMGVD